MELVQELFVTAFVALIFSFVVAKLVSMAMSGDDQRDLGLKSIKTETVVEEVKFDAGLRVQRTETKRVVQFLEEEEAVETVDEFGIRERSVDKSEESRRSREEFVEERCDSAVMCDSGSEVCRTGMDGIKEEEEHAVTNLELDGLVVKEGRERTEVDQIDVMTGTGLVVEEKTVEKAEADSKIVGGSASDDVVAAAAKGAEGIRDVESGENQDEKEEEEEDADDDWEGIERSELEEVFAAAVNYVATSELGNVGGDVPMQLYGLHKVAMEGPCHEPQPMPLKLSARAKWNAWQRLGNMNPEVAMEQYVALLSDKVPEWMEGKSSGDDNADSLESGTPAAPYPNISTSPYNQLNSSKKRELELNSGNDGGDLAGGSNSVNKE